MAKQFDQKVALVTGAGLGIGRATALAFAREGARVVVADVIPEGGEETVRMVKKAGGEAIFIKVNVCKALEVEQMVSQAIAKYGRLDYAHNNAGVEQKPLARTADCLEKDWDRVIEINLKGVFLCMKYEILQMLKQGIKGAIVNTSSVRGLAGIAERPAYTASKHAVVGLTKAAALDYADKGIRVNCVCPAAIRTALLERIIAQQPEMEQTYAARQPIGRIGTPEDVAGAVIWLCSDSASFITGHALAIDGGLLSQ